MQSYFLFIFAIYLSSPKCILTAEDLSDWIDPHEITPDYDFYNSYKQDNMQTEIDETDLATITQNYNCDDMDSQTINYLKRTVHMILNSVHEDLNDEHIYKGHLVFEIDLQKYETLKEFADGKFTNLRITDKILSEILQKPSSDYLREYFTTWYHRCFMYLSSRTGIVGICATMYIYVVFKLLKGHYNTWYIVKFLGLNVLLLEFGFMYVHLYQKTEIENVANKMKYLNSPVYCNPNEMSTWRFFLYSFSSEDECKNYYHATLTDIFWVVSPGSVAVEMCTRLITQPAGAIGGAFSAFISGIMNALPWGVNIFLLPVVLIFALMMTCILLSFIFSVPIKINALHLISFSFGDSGRKANGNVLTGKTVDKLLDIVKDQNVPRVYVEECRENDACGKEKITERNPSEYRKEQLSKENLTKNEVMEFTDTKMPMEIVETLSKSSELAVNKIHKEQMNEGKRKIEVGGGDT